MFTSIDPVQAKGLLANMAPSRSARQNRIDYLADQMKGDDWNPASAEVTITEGRMTGGQNIMHAIIKHGQPVQVTVIGDDR